MNLSERIKKRLAELDSHVKNMRMVQSGISTTTYAEKVGFHQWATSTLNLIQGIFGPESAHYKNLVALYTKPDATNERNYRSMIGVFYAAKDDYEGGYLFRMESVISGEIFGDFVVAAKQALKEGQKDVAAVLACAALEDALKRHARLESLQVDDQDMSAVVNALKARRLVTGAQKSLLDTMPKIRNYAMHANWDKISAEDVASVIGFVEQFLLTHFG